MSRRNGTGQGAAAEDLQEDLQFVDISDETRRRYLNYAMSVIMSRALPDVRDGLKPVQRRILYVMWNEFRLLPDAKFVKCGRIVGDTMGKFHPHGDQAIYDALVRLAQDFTFRETLVWPQGNFGNIMGLPPAAPRYTEAKLTSIATRLLQDLRYNTVDMRPTYDGATEEPVVLPAQFPNLLVNGTQGIAVGMATSIPPHNLDEIIRGCIQLIQNPEASTAQVMRSVKGPDFPLGGRIVTDKEELKQIYEEGRGSIKVRAEWKYDEENGKLVKSRIVIFSIPYGVETGPLLNSIGEVRDSRKLPQLVDVADESDQASGMRIVLHIKPGADPETVMAYLYKHTKLEDNFAYNATCLVPDEHGNLLPKRCHLAEILKHFLDFRFVTIKRRFEYLLAQLERRIHILQGFAIIFDGLDKALKIIRASSGKQDAAEKLMKAFPLDLEQTMAVLDLALYRISTLEIDEIRQELADKEKEAKRIRGILKSKEKLWGEVQGELEELQKAHKSPRRTEMGSSEEIAEFDPQAYIVRENTNIVLTTEAWIRRVGKISTIDKLRVREGEEVAAVAQCTTLDNVIFFSSDGTAYTLPADQIPASTGYGEPLSKHVRLSDGAHIVSIISTDPRFTPEDTAADEAPPAPYLFIATSDGSVMRLSLSGFRLPSTKNGRRFCRLAGDAKVVHAEIVNEEDTIFLISHEARLIHFSVTDVPILNGPGKGVRGLKLVEPKDHVMGAKRLTRPSDVLKVINENDKELSFGQMKYTITSRGGKGIKTSQRTSIERIVRPAIELVDFTTLGEGE